MTKRKAKKAIKKIGSLIIYIDNQPAMIVDRYGQVELTEVWTLVKPHIWKQ